MNDLLTCTLTLNREVVLPASQPQLVYALVEIMPSGAATNARLPLNLALVLDRSGSMIVDDKIKRLREAVKYLIDQLQPADYISIITFIQNADVIVPAQPARDRNALKRKAQQVDTEDIAPWYIPIMMQMASETDVLPALKAGIAEAKKTRGPNRLSRLILLTDGQLMHPNDVTKLAHQAGKENIPILALGIGTDWNDALMQAIARESGGVADYIAQPNDIQGIFQKALTSLQATVVRNATFTVRTTSGVEIRKVWRVVPLIADLGHAPSLPLGDVEKDTGQTLLVEFLLPPRTAGSYRMAQVEITYDVPALKLTSERVRADLVVRFAPDAAQFPINPRVMNLAERVTAFKLQTRALEDVRAGNAAAATEKLRSAATMLLNQGETDLARTLRLEADNIQQSGTLSAEGSKTIKFKGGQTRRLP